MRQALLVVDVQNEFSKVGKRAVPNHDAAVEAIRGHVRRARREKWPIAWVQHHNRPNESAAFVPGSWGAELTDGLGPEAGFGVEQLLQKDVFGAFTGTHLEEWLRANEVSSVLIVGFYAHMCVSTSVREALVRGFDVMIDPEATGATDIEDPVLGKQTADEVKRSALLQLTHMGARVYVRERHLGALEEKDGGDGEWGGAAGRAGFESGAGALHAAVK
jgi:nicotinamidase-related amidase